MFGRVPGTLLYCRWQARKDILAPWLLAFTEDDPAKGGCPRYTPPGALLASLPARTRRDYLGC